MAEAYTAAKRLGDWAVGKAVISGRYPYLPALEEIVTAEKTQGEYNLGEMEIPLEDIVGTRTAGRQQAFAGNFMPILDVNSEFALKWISLYHSAMEEGIREPVSVCEYMHKFYVIEGNKRVSVMKYNGAVSIAAKVTRLLPKRTEEPENRLYFEFVDFFRDSGIYRITFSQTGSYRELGQVLGMQPGKKWPAELVRDVRAGYDRFRELYRQQKGSREGLTTGDAYLIYLRIYGLPQLLETSTGEIRQNLEKIQNEFKKSAGEVTLIANPEELQRENGLMDIFMGSSATGRKMLTAAFVYEKNPETSRWAYAHELGRNYLVERLGESIRTLTYGDCGTEERVLAAIDDAAGQKADFIFTTSGSMLESSVKAAVQHPEIRILNCTVNTSFNSIRTYYGRMYEAKFLMGALAAALCEEQEIGYVELCPLYGTVANINAFAIGAQLVRPKIKVRLQWEAEKGSDWRREFRQRGIHMISGPEYGNPQSRSREFGLYRVLADGRVENLANPMMDWGRYYEILIRSVMEGGFGDSKLGRSHQALNYWFGMSAGVIDVIFSGSLDYSAEKLVKLLKRGIVSGQISPFHGEIHSQEGVVKKAGSVRPSAEEIVSMRWLNENIEGRIPEISDFTEEAQELIRTGGFLR